MCLWSEQYVTKEDCRAVMEFCNCNFVHDKFTTSSAQKKLVFKDKLDHVLLQDAFSENARHLQKALIAYLTVRSGSDPSCVVSSSYLMLCPFLSVLALYHAFLSLQYARNFYLGQWLRDNMTEMEKGLRSSPPGSPSSRTNNAFPDPLLLSVRDANEDGVLPSLSPSAQLVHQAEQTKEFLLSLVEPMAPQVAG